MDGNQQSLNDTQAAAAAAWGRVLLPAAAAADVVSEMRAQACQLSASAPRWAATSSSAACAAPVLLLDAANFSVGSPGACAAPVLLLNAANSSVGSHRQLCSLCCPNPAARSGKLQTLDSLQRLEFAAFDSRAGAAQAPGLPVVGPQNNAPLGHPLCR